MQRRRDSLVPLIGSVEGIASTPAYRGLAIAVFEDLELGEFGNRIPFLTFEVEANTAAPSVGGILADASAEAVLCDSDRQLVGFAAYGSSIKAAIEPLVDSFGLDLVDDGIAIRSADDGTIYVIGRDELGSSVTDKSEPRVERDQALKRSLPSTLRLTYYDPARDYQTGEARAAAGEAGGVETQRDLPAVMIAGDAKSLAQDMLARSWTQSETLTLRLPPPRLAMVPGAVVQLAASPLAWTVRTATLDGFMMVLELEPSNRGTPAVAADSGRIAINREVQAGPLSLALFDVPVLFGTTSDEPIVLLAASRPGDWRRRPVEIGVGEQSFMVETARSKSVLGQATSVLPPGTTDLIDNLDSVDVELADPDQWLVNCDDDALAGGTNLAVLGNELFQFGRATPLGSGKFRLERLLRGRGGTDWACAGHAVAESFCLLDPRAITAIPVALWAVGTAISASSDGAVASVPFGAQSLRPLSPVNLIAEQQAGGNIALRWTRRSRRGFAWIDGMETPLGEAQERYRVVAAGSAATFEAVVDQPAIIFDEAILTTLGPGPGEC